MEDSPAKLSVAELAGRFKGHILPMPAAHDESPFRRKPPCSLKFPIRKDDGQESNTNTNRTISVSPVKIRMKNSSVIERLQANLALSPTTLLPSPKSPKANRQPDSPSPTDATTATTPLAPTLQPTQLSGEEEGEDQEDPISFDSPPEGTSLPSFHKTRVRLSFKRRPPTRQHRRSAGEEAAPFDSVPSPCELHSLEANGDVILQCPGRVTLKEDEGDGGEKDRDCVEAQGEQLKTPPEEEKETREEQQTDGGNANAPH
ncbi:capZ-interacting protein isoform X2 [Vanacampus margaritifer]